MLWLLILLYFGLFFVFSGMESTLALWCEAVLNMGPRQVGYYLAFAGICGVIVQGGIVGRLVPRLGEAQVIIIGLVCLAVGLGGLPLVSFEIWLLLPIALLSIGFGFANPSLQSLISRAAPDDMRGGTMGVAQSTNSLGRITGHAWGGVAFVGWEWVGRSTREPYLCCPSCSQRLFSLDASNLAHEYDYTGCAVASVVQEPKAGRRLESILTPELDAANRPFRHPAGLRERAGGPSP